LQPVAGIGEPCEALQPCRIVAEHGAAVALDYQGRDVVASRHCAAQDFVNAKIASALLDIRAPCTRCASCRAGIVHVGTSSISLQSASPIWPRVASRQNAKLNGRRRDARELAKGSSRINRVKIVTAEEEIHAGVPKRESLSIALQDGWIRTVAGGEQALS
jgi:hypothetical protein